MIYLIDDKVSRQLDFGWDQSKFDHYKDVLVVISTIEKIQEYERKESFQAEENIILFHESFFNNIHQKHKRFAETFTNKLSEFSNSSNFPKTVLFSGSYGSREFSEYGGSLSVSIMYQNLGVFLDHCIDDKSVNLDYLFFGENIEIERKLIEKKENANAELINQLSSGKLDAQTKNLFVLGNGQGFVNPIANSITYNYLNKNINDHGMTTVVESVLNQDEYDNIFIPLCFGPILSDFNGLRFATHIRCTPSLNRLNNLFIYTFFDDYFEILENPYALILKTHNVFLIPSDRPGFESALSRKLKPLLIENLPREIHKLKLDVPDNYEDPHSIANEWAISQWARTINLKGADIDRIDRKISSNIYFKYLKTIYPFDKSLVLGEKELLLNYRGSKVLLVDDEADKGWESIFRYILTTVNQIDLEILDVDYKNTTQENLIEKAMDIVRIKNIDLVLLDFRLLSIDAEQNKIVEKTSVRLLDKIKNTYNKGVQVIFFSATNKLWNLQKLQELDSDGFILKESINNSMDIQFSKRNIENALDLIKQSLRMKYLKRVCEKFDEIRALSKNNPELNDFFKKIENDLEISYNLLTNTWRHQKYFNYAYLQLFLIIERFVNENKVFVEGNKSYVVRQNGQNKLVQEKLEENDVKNYIRYSKGIYEEGEEIKNEPQGRLGTYFKVSAVLIHKYGNDSSDVKDWPEVNKIRNVRAAHYNKIRPLNQHDIFMILNFIKYFIDASNEKKGVKNLSWKDSKNFLKNNPGNFIIKKSKK